MSDPNTCSACPQIDPLQQLMQAQREQTMAMHALTLEMREQNRLIGALIDLVAADDAEDAAGPANYLDGTPIVCKPANSTTL